MKFKQFTFVDGNVELLQVFAEALNVYLVRNKERHWYLINKSSVSEVIDAD